MFAFVTEIIQHVELGADGTAVVRVDEIAQNATAHDTLGELAYANSHE
jgi:hypothetical protein